MLTILLLLTASAARAQRYCDEAVAIPEAAKRYATGNFDDVFALLKPCSEKGFSETARVQAYKILSMSYLAIDSLPQSTRAIGQLLALNPKFEPDFSAPPRYKALFQWVRETQEQVVQVTSVSKKAEDIRYAPATVEVLTSKDFELRGYQTLEDILHDLPGFDVIRGKGVGYSNFYQRGYRSTSNDRTLILIDGVEENDLVSNTVSISPQYPLSSIDRVEVIYGPASTLYGANAFVGVINIITRSFKAQPGPSRMIGLKAQTRYGSNNTRYFDGVLSARTGDVALSVTGRLYRSDEADLSRYGEYNFGARTADDYGTRLDLTGTDANGAYLAQAYVTKNQLLTRYPNSNLFTPEYAPNGQVSALRLTPQGAAKAARLDNNLFGNQLSGSPVDFSNDKMYWFVRGKLEFNDLTISYLDWKADEGATPWYTNLSTISTPKNPRWITHDRAFSITYTKAFSEKFQLLNLASYLLHEIDGNTSLVTYNGYYNNRLSFLELARDTVARATTTYYYRVSSQLRNELRLFWTPGFNLDINGGVEVRSGLIQGNYITSRLAFADETGSVANASSLLGGNNFRTTDLGVYAQANYRPTQNLKLVGGLRLDYNRVRSNGGYGAVLNPRLAAIYSFQKYTFKAIYAQAFKDASFLQKYGTTATRLLTNPKLEPEHVNNLEFSGSYQASKQLTGSVAAYFSNYSNAVGVAPAKLENGTPTTQFQALGRRYIWGLQADVNYRAERLNVWANATYTNPLDRDTNQRLSDIAEYMANAGAGYRITSHLSYYLAANYVGGRQTGAGTSGSLNPQQRFPAFVVLNTNLSYHDLLLPGLTLQAAVNNLLDNEYFVPGIRDANGVAQASRFVQDRRLFSVALYYQLRNADSNL